MNDERKPQELNLVRQRTTAVYEREKNVYEEVKRR